MDKKEIYEHLAKIYLDASSKKKKKAKHKTRFVRNLVLVLLSCVVVAVFSYSVFFRDNEPSNSEISLVLLSDAAKINFNFDPAKKEIFKLGLNKLNVGRFRTLAFSVRKTNYQDNISLRVEFRNIFNEKSEVYVKNIPSRWQDYEISLAEFKDISDWSEMTNLSFVVEEWNARQKHGVVYVDNVRLLK